MFFIVFIALSIFVYFYVLDATKDNALARYFIHYPLRVVVTLGTVAILGSCVLVLIMPFVWVSNGLFSTEYGILSANTDAKRITEFNAVAFWLVLYVPTIVALFLNFRKTEREANERLVK